MDAQPLAAATWSKGLEKCRHCEEAEGRRGDLVEIASVAPRPRNDVRFSTTFGILLTSFQAAALIRYSPVPNKYSPDFR